MLGIEAALDSMPRQLRIIIPACNEAERIEKTVRAFCSYYSGQATIVVVANGCSDQTAEVVLSLMQIFRNLELIDIKQRIGKGGAVRVGFKSGSEPIICFVDADGSTKPSELAKLVKACNECALAGAVGSRWLRSSIIVKPQPLVRRIASRAFNLLVRLLFGIKFSDTQCGAKVFRRTAIDSVINDLEIANFAFDVDLLYALKRANLTVVEIPIAWTDAPEASKVRILASSVSMMQSMLRLRLRHGLFRKFPFVDLIAKDSSIVVKHSFRLLIINRETAAQADPASPIVNLIELWKMQGHSVNVLSISKPMRFLKTIEWYLGVGHGEVDAIIDVASGLFPILRFSSKPTLIVARDLENLKFEFQQSGKRFESDDFAEFLLNKLISGIQTRRRFHTSNGVWALTLGEKDSSTTIMLS